MGSEYHVLVYGDRCRRVDAAEMVRSVQRRASAVAASGGRAETDALRTLLIHLGQLEQAVEDEFDERTPKPRWLNLVRACCDDAAEALVSRWRAESADAGAGGDADGNEHIQRLARSAEKLAALSRSPPAELNRPVTAKTPEGFAFYALYPEQYCAAAERWSARHASVLDRSSPIRVVGVRSIGTSLSAVVAALLRQTGWRATQRMSVRPRGGATSRHVQIDPAQINAEHDDTERNAPPVEALVVDEGPGLSGSSMAAVASALARAGVRPERISFFPGHKGEPGALASGEVRRWWSIVPRYNVSLDELRWRGRRTLSDELAAMSGQLIGKPAHDVEDLGGGRWRAALFGQASQAEWPAVFASFERRKYLCRANGDRSALLWKFEGLTPAAPPAHDAAGAARLRLETRAAGGWTARPLASAHGWVATPWVEGMCLRSADLTPQMIDHLGRYIAGAAGSDRRSAPNWSGAVERLRRVICANTAEALGDAMARRVRQHCDVVCRQAVRAASDAAMSYGDGRMAPVEWRRLPGDGRILKLDCVGHCSDHTIVGHQSSAWDIAGAIVEWKLDDAATRRLLRSISASAGDGSSGDGGSRAAEISPPVLWFYCAAYAAFRLGMCALCGSKIAGESADDFDSGGGEPERLRRAYESYRADLAQLIECAPTPAISSGVFR